MKLITFQPKEVLKQLEQSDMIQADYDDYNESEKYSRAVARASGYKPIWCIPLFNTIDTLYNIIRCSPSYPQRAIIFEKDKEYIDFINYTVYSDCVRDLDTVNDESTDFSECLCDLDENNLAHYEAIVQNIKKEEIIDIIEITNETEMKTVQNKFVDFTLSDKLKEVLSIKYDLVQPDDAKDNALTAYEALGWHKLVGYSLITDKTIDYSLKMFKEHCIK